MDTVPASKLVDMLNAIEPIGNLAIDVYAWTGETYTSTGELDMPATLKCERYVSLRDYWSTRLQQKSA